MNHDEMVDLLDSLKNATDVLEGSEHDLAMGHKPTPEDLKLWKALKTFVNEFRGISVEVVASIRKAARR